MNIRICTPVIGKTIDTFFSNLKKIQEISDFIELRVDYVENFKEQDLDIIRQRTLKKAILTCRQKLEGGCFIGSEDDRVKILQKAIRLFEYVDIELSTIQKNPFVRNEKTKLIISYHNIKITPSYWDMQEIIHTMNTFDPDIIKIVTMINKDYEVAKVYRLLTNKPHNEERIVVGMGEMGKTTRVIGPLLGSYLTYASTKWGKSAPGQIEYSVMKKIINKVYGM